MRLQLGQGEYFVREDKSWAWRYGQSYQVNGVTVPSGADGRARGGLAFSGRLDRGVREQAGKRRVAG